MDFKKRKLDYYQVYLLMPQFRKQKPILAHERMIFVYFSLVYRLFFAL